ncbi:MAG: hypothetical protein SFW67_11585 [Myxococcaceae bacterium]|nr:hypothetical protein [Myxococcaceae bacterium]
MTAEQKAQLRETKRRLGEQLRAARNRATTALEANPALVKARRCRRLRRALTVAALLLLLLFLRCEGPTPEGPQPTASPAPKPEPKPPTAPLAKKPVVKKPVVASRPVERPDFDAPARPQAAWLDGFRLQVAARSPRLSRCFIGAERPGALRWTSLVSTSTGAVGSHEFETVGTSVDLTKEQRACLEAALSSPGYGLEGAPTEGLPQRVSLVLEF